MKKYNLAYDYYFLTNNFDKGISYKGENIESISIYMIFKLIDKRTGEEFHFLDEDLSEQQIEYADRKFCYVRDYYSCSIDEKEGYKMRAHEMLLAESNYSVSYEVGDCIKWLDNQTAVIIECDELVDIIKNNFSEFNISDNKPAQGTSYYAVEVKKETELKIG
ncbi:hypothetical protein ACPV3A_14510 [Paenibacillus sp. Dod16]|uniref:hypothetical protein n=1 Tax=Paenibacillus sp. Dod16 TaxID=3416392 RepID=UPI003CF1B704